MQNARQLRQAMTQAERKLWYALRDRRLGFKFRRQVPRGPYIVDFACLECRVVVEVDGAQHIDSEHDARRDAWLRSQGYLVLRFWNPEVLANLEGVLMRITEACGARRPPHPRCAGPLPEGRGESVTVGSQSP